MPPACAVLQPPGHHSHGHAHADAAAPVSVLACPVQELQELHSSTEVQELGIRVIINEADIADITAELDGPPGDLGSCGRPLSPTVCSLSPVAVAAPAVAGAGLSQRLGARGCVSHSSRWGYGCYRGVLSQRIILQAASALLRLGCLLKGRQQHCCADSQGTRMTAAAAALH